MIPVFLRIGKNKAAASTWNAYRLFVRHYAGPPGGFGGFPGGLQFGGEKYEKGQALKEFVSCRSYQSSFADIDQRCIERVLI